jgi:hypothetical protein
MATPYAQQQMIRRGGVSFMPRPTPQTVMPVRRQLTRREVQQQQQEQGQPVGRLGALAAYAAATPHAQQRAMEQAQQAAYDELPWYKKGLAAAVDNPIVNTGLKAMDILSIPRRAIQVGVSEAAAAMPEWTENIPYFAAMRFIDEEKVREDPRSVGNRIFDPNYGFGQVAKDTGNQWANRGVGFAGDVIMDPFTYVTGPTMKVAEGAEVAALGAKALTQGKRAVQAGDWATTTARAAQESGAFADEAAAMIAKGMADQEYLTRYAADEAYQRARAAPGGTRRVAARTNRAGRLQELSQAGARLPEEFMRRPEVLEEFARIAQRGPGAARTPEIREALGLLDPKLQFLGADLPGTGRIAQGFQRGGAVARGAVNRSGLGTKFARGSRGIETGVEELIGRGSGRGDTYQALAEIYAKNQIREGREIEGIANQMLRDFRGSNLKRLSPQGKARLIKQAETKSTGMTPLNKMMGSLAELYQQVTGRRITEYLRDKETYFPHMLTPGGRQFMASEEKGAEELRRRAGFMIEDLLEGSGFLEKRRQFTPNADGTPRKMEINGREVTFKTGTLDEVNEQLNKAFPELGKDFKFYETNPEHVIEAYATSLSKGAGRDIAAKRLAESEYPFMITNTGQVAREQQAMNAALARQNPLMDAVRAGFQPGTDQLPVKPPVPTSSVFEPGVDKEATRLAAKFAQGQEAQAYVSAAKQSARDKIAELIARIKEGRTDLVQNLVRQEGELGGRIAQEEASKVSMAGQKKALRELREAIQVVTKDRDTTAAELRDYMIAIKQEIADLEVALAAENRNVGRRLTTAERKTREAIHSHIDSYRQLEAALTERLKSMGPLEKEYVERRTALFDPIAEARKELGQAETRFTEKAPHSPEKLAQAQRVKAGITEEKLRPPTKNERLLDVEWDRADTRARLVLEDAARRPKGDEAIARAQAVLAEPEPSDTRKWRKPAPGEVRYEAPEGTYSLSKVDMGDGPEWIAVHPDDQAFADAWPTMKEAQAAVVAHSKSLAADIKAARTKARAEARDVLKKPPPTKDQIARAKATQRAAEAYRREAAAARATGRPEMPTDEALRIIRENDAWVKRKDAVLAPARRKLELAERAAQRQQEAIVTGRQTPGGATERLWHPGIEQSERAVRPLPMGETPPRAAYAEEPRPDTVEMLASISPNEPYPLGVPPSESEALRELKQTIVPERESLTKRLETAKQRKMGVVTGAPERIAEAKRPIAESYGEKVADIEGQLTSRRLGSQTRLESQRVEVRKAKERVVETTKLAQDKAAEIQRMENANQVAKDNIKELKKKVQETGRQRTKVSKNLAKTADMRDVERTLIKPMEEVLAANPNLDDPVMATTYSLLNEASNAAMSIELDKMMASQVRKMGDAAAKGRLADVSIAVLSENWKTLHGGLPQYGDYLADAEFAKRFQNLFELSKEPKLFGRVFNAYTNLFKTWATLSPGFQVRNSLGGIFMNTSDGVTLQHQLRGANLWRQFLKEGKPWLDSQPQEIRDAFRATFSTGAGGRYTEGGVVSGSTPFKRGARAYEAAMNNPLTRLGQRAGNRVEGSLRLAMAVDSIARGETVQEAIVRINRIHFDYADVSKLDEQAKRIIPFWTFMSRNLPLQITQMWTKPRTYLQYESFVRNFSSPDVENTPEYMTDAGAWNTGGTLGGLPLYLMPDLGYQQLQAQQQMVSRTLSQEQPLAILSMANPGLTAPAEYMTRQDFFTGQQFPKDEGFAPAKGPLAPLLTAAATLTGNTNEMGQIDPRFTNAMRAMIPVLDRQMRLAPGVLSADTNQGTTSRQLESWLRWFGAPVRTITPEQQENEARRLYMKQLDELERRMKMRAAAS